MVTMSAQAIRLMTKNIKKIFESRSNLFAALLKIRFLSSEPLLSARTAVGAPKKFNLAQGFGVEV